MLTVWGRASSSNVQAVMWCIGELGLDYERIDAGLHFGVTETPAYRRINPNGTVPTLCDGEGAPIWETGAILRYLASAYGAEPFWPSGPAACAQIDKWAEWSKVNVARLFTVPVFWNVVRTPPSRRDPTAIREAVRALEQALEIAEAQLERHRYLAGDSLTLADIQFGHCLYRYFDIEIERGDLPNLLGYYGALTERPAYREHVMVSYEELRESD